MKFINFSSSYTPFAWHSTVVRPRLVGFAIAFAVMGISPAQADVTQTLDSVDAISGKRVLEMRFGEFPRPAAGEPGYLPQDAASLTAPVETFLACQRSANRDLYCLLNSYVGADGRLTQPVRRWSEGGSTQDLFSCTDPSLGLDRRKANPCTSMTVDLTGNLWLGGRNGTAHSVIKVVEVDSGGSCSVHPFPGAGRFQRITDLSAGSDFCFRPYATGRPIIVDMTTIDDKVGAAFRILPADKGGAGVLLLEERKTVVFVADPKDPDSGLMLEPLAPVQIASGKTGWGLQSGEEVQSAALLQLDCIVGSTCTDGTDEKANYVLATTSKGRVVAKRTDPLGAAVGLFQNPSPQTCGSTAVPQYGVRVSPQSGRVFVSDRNCAVVRELEVSSIPVGLSQLYALSTATEPATLLSTISVSPGIGFNLYDCMNDDCILYPDDGDDNAEGARITSVQVDPAGKSGLTVFRITGIPDCRYAPHRGDGVCAALPNGGIVMINGEEYLDVAGLLPLEVRSLFDDSTSTDAGRPRAAGQSDVPGPPAGQHVRGLLRPHGGRRYRCRFPRDLRSHFRHRPAQREHGQSLRIPELRSQPAYTGELGCHHDGVRAHQGGQCCQRDRRRRPCIMSTCS